MKKKILIITAIALFFVLALGLTLYPLISSYINEKYRSEIHTQYMDIVQQTDDSAMEKAKSDASKYNEAISPGTMQSDIYSQEALIAAAEGYEELLNLAGDGIMGYVEIPKISVQLPIYHGTDSDVLERGIGHLLGSSLPVGGDGTHAILTGHSGMATQKMFSDLVQLKVGDVFYLKILNDTLAYEVDSINTVLPHDTSLLQISHGEDYCTLITCTPFGVNTHRLLVRGTRIPYVESEETALDTVPKETAEVSTWEQEYIKGIVIGLGSVAVIGIIILAIWIHRRKRNENL